LALTFEQTKDGKPFDWSRATLSQVSNLIYKSNFSIQRIESAKYHYYADVDSFPSFYDQEFDSIQEVEFELRKHAQQHGYDIRLSNVDRDPQGIVRMRRFVCSCEGKKRSSSTNGSNEFSWTNPPQGKQTTSFSASSLIASVIMNKKNSRCGCPYFVVYKRRQSEMDPSKFVYRAHSLDTFHNHLREGDRIVRETERLSNSLPPSSDRAQSSVPFVNDVFSGSTDFKMLYELLSDASSDKGLEYILQCIFKLAQISPDHYRHINMEMKKYLRDITLSIASAAAESLGCQPDHDPMHHQLPIPPMVEAIFSKDNISTADLPLLEDLQSDNTNIHTFTNNNRTPMSTNDMNMATNLNPNRNQPHHHQHQQIQQQHALQKEYAPGTTSSSSNNMQQQQQRQQHSILNNGMMDINNNKLSYSNTTPAQPITPTQYQLYNREGLTATSMYQNPFFPSIVPGVSIPNNLYVSSVHNSDNTHLNHNGQGISNDLSLPLQQPPPSHMFSLLPEVFSWLHSSDGRERRDDDDQSVSDDTEHEIFQVFNSNSSAANTRMDDTNTSYHNSGMLTSTSSTIVPNIPNAQPSSSIEQSGKRRKR
jgi:hypothetical protein